MQIKKLFIILILLLFSSCNQQETIKNSLIEERDVFFNKKNISKESFQYKYYINQQANYTHYVLECYRIINNDSVIIYFTRDETADYFIDSNDNYFKYYK